MQQQLDDRPIIQLQDLSKSVSYLEAIAFSSGYQAIASTLRFCGLLIKNCENPSPDFLSDKEKIINLLNNFSHKMEERWTNKKKTDLDP